MAGAIIVIDQPTGAGSGTPGVARNDLWLSQPVTLSVGTTGNTSFQWTLLNSPPGSAATLGTPTASTSTWTPDVYGTYRIRLVTNGGGPGNTQIRIVRVRKNASGVLVRTGKWSLPAVGEQSGENNYVGNTRSWADPIEEIINDIDSQIDLFGGRDVDTTAPAANEVPTWDGSAWAPSPVKIDGRAVAVSAPTTNQVLVWSGSAWTPSAVKIDGRDIAVSVPATNQVLVWNGSAWAPSAVKLDGRDVSTSAPTTGDALVWSGASWGGANVIGTQPMIGASWNNPGRPYIQKAEGPTVAASGTYTMLDIAGAGYMTQFFMSINGSDANGRRNTRLKIYIDGEGTPSVDVMMVDLMCSRGVEAAGGAGTAQAMFMSRYVGYTSFAFGYGIGGFLYIDIPFSTHIKVDIVNGSSTNSIVLGGYVQYYLKSGLSWGRYQKLHGTSINGVSVVKYVEQTLLDIAGQGVLHGAYIHLQGGDSNYNYLEGNLNIYIDSEVSASCAYDSTEDYFMYPWYFWIANNTRNVVTDFVGCTRKDDSAQVGAYRWHIRDPISFDTHLKFTWVNGELAAAVVVNNTTVNGVIWYYTTS